MIQLPFLLSEYRSRLSAIRAEMARRNLDLLIVNDVASQHYITGYDGWSFYTPQVSWYRRQTKSRSGSAAPWMPRAGS
ncbi:aminopeptidase P family N-terminal domain-containing protein [Mesorhizobium sp. WSM3882]|uniref:aminopeptidase P family N-terminal domain-containing protein n=1 Tax=Mesorhizobium sp. WSM3882 TaxID=2029407 RepID=UPI001FDA72BE|nr:aminopeptidase P family N-terminal domain-containing protein [Mesorhizobium sp. WSM3882]